MQQDMKARTRTPWLGVGAAGLALLLSGCAPSSADVMLGGLATPSPVPPGPPGSPDGLYTGVADNIGGECPQTMTISNFRVEGNVLRFGLFRGPVAPDGSVSLLAAGMTLNGHFQGDMFTGRVDTDNDLGIYVRPLRLCLYAITVRRTAM